MSHEHSGKRCGAPEGRRTSQQTFDLAAIRARLAAGEAPGQWRGLEQLVDSPDVRALLEREFPAGASLLGDQVGRREFLRLMGASLALAGVTGCTAQPLEPIVPFVRQPESYVPGRPLFFATAMTHGGFANGLLVETHLGRPTKVEGNPDHPTSLGATDTIAQASILSLYDPDRSPTVTFEGRIRPWGAFIAAVQTAMRGHRRRNGLGLSLLTERVSSPTLIAQIRALQAELPQARWYQYEPVDRDNVRAGARLAFGEAVEAHYRLDAAEVIVSFESDFLADAPDSLRLARQFAARRQPSAGRPASRLYVAESTLSLTGARADHRLALGPADIERVARAVAGRLGIGLGVPGLGPDLERFVTAVARDLGAHPGTSLVTAGPAQPPVVHALAHVLNQTLGNMSRTVEYADPADAPAEDNRTLTDLLAEIDAGRVGTLVVLGGNPAYSAPADLQFAERLQKVELRIHLGAYSDETAAICQWHVPEAHFLEAWSDARAFDGTATIVQPMIAPLYGGKSAHELLVALSSRTDRSGYDVVREHWREWFAAQRAASGQQPAESATPAAGVAPAPPPEPQPATAAAPPPAPGQPATAQAAEPGAAPPAAAPPADPEFERFWRRALHDGVVAGTAIPLRALVAGTDWLAQAEPPAAEVPGLQVLFRPDPTIYDGRFANNGWLQELPKPLTKLTWDNAALIGPRTAEELGISQRLSFRGGEHGELIVDVVELAYGGRTLRAPVLIAPGQADGCVTLHLGYGRTRAGRAGTGAGFNASLVRTSNARWAAAGLELRVTGDTYSLASTQSHHSMEGRGFVRETTVQRFAEDPATLHEGHHAPPRTLTLYPEHPQEGAAWGMAIDLNACTGCNACIVACQAENNVPVVGKPQVLRGREMHWLRVDRYHQGDPAAPETLFQPVPCMHCENAPCEVVCPVGATSHSAEGLNEMVYNRCVGTRYCSNNCPYKVRRFNFLLYADWETPSLKPMRNPDVTVRSRGVMEKCTYCVQRINAARIDAKQEGRPIRDGEVVTACEAVCPAQAIVFGDLNDPTSRVARLKTDARHYSLLADLNTRPRTTYLGLLRHPNPELPPGSGVAPSEP